MFKRLYHIVINNLKGVRVQTAPLYEGIAVML